jgi:hypothetical protein
MAKKNWDKIAQDEFESMDKRVREDWKDLRRIVENRL